MPDQPPQPGVLFAIGGAEDKLHRRQILRSFTDAAGGQDARIVVIPTASALGPEIIDVYAALFRSLGAASAVGVRPESRADAESDAFCEPLMDATGVFMTGGNQLKLSAVVNGTRFGAQIKAAHARGAVVGGTSAGASILADHMVAFGRSGATPRQRMTQMASGLGLVQTAIIDQHFAQRNRYGRLLSMVSQSPNLLGIGIDEDTAAVIEGDHLDVVGHGVVTVMDAIAIQSNAHEVRPAAPLLASGVVLHVLPHTAVFDLAERRLLSHGEPPDAEELSGLAAANDDLRTMAADIAAEGVSPSYYRQHRRRVRRPRASRVRRDAPRPRSEGGS